MKKKNILIALLGLIVSTVVIYSCGKDDKKPTKTELISSKTWKLVKDQNTVPPQACKQDDRFVFFANGVTNQLTGTSKCGNQADNIPGQWNFNAAEDSIFFSFKGLLVKLNKLDNDSLVVQTSVGNSNFITAFVPQ